MAVQMEKKAVNISLVIKWLITMVVPFLLFLVPVDGMFTREIRLFLVLTLIAIFIVAFELLNYIVPGILLPTFYTLTGLVPVNVAFAGWASYVPWMVLGAFVLANIFGDTKFLSRIAYFCILKMGGSFLSTCIGIIIVALPVYMLTGGNGILLLVVLCYGVAQSFQITLKSKEAIVLLLAGTLGSVSVACFVPAPLTLALLTTGARVVDETFAMNYGSFVWHNIPYIFFIFGFFFLVYKFLKPDVKINGKSSFQEAYQQLGPISLAEKKCAFVSIVLVVFLLGGNLFGIDPNWGFVLVPWILYLPGMNVGTKEHIQQVDISTLIFAVMCVGIGVVSGVLGFGQLFTAVLLEILGDISAGGMLFFVAIVGILLNVLLTPMAVLGAFAAPFAQVAIDLDMNILPVFYVLAQSMDQIFMPYEYIPYLLFFSYGFIKMGDFIKLFTLKMVLHLVFLMVIMVPWWHIVGIL